MGRFLRQLLHDTLISILEVAMQTGLLTFAVSPHEKTTIASWGSDIALISNSMEPTPTFNM
jgi:hypothetical protein